jgi:hypothetical protein
VIIGGQLIEPLPGIEDIRKRARAGLAQWPSRSRHTGHSLLLKKLDEELRAVHVPA